jgi:formylglycine-generating enzyme required for sulfatase activity
MSKTKILEMIIFCVFAFCPTSMAAVSIDIRGKIVSLASDSVTLDSVPEAKVFLKNHAEVRCSTDEHGLFRLTNDPHAAILQTFAGAKGVQFRVLENHSGLFVRMNNSGKKADMSVYNLDGRMIATARLESRGKGECFIPFPHAARAVHLIKISTDNTTWVHRTNPTTKAAITFDQRQKENNSVFGKKNTGVFIDSLVVYLNGYKAGLFGIKSYDTTGFVGGIEKSRTWDNCEGLLLTRSGSMAMMATKNYNFEMGQYCDTIWGKKSGLATSDFEQPVHTVSFTKNFYIDTVEITQGEYDSLMKATYPGYSRPVWSSVNGQGSNYPVYSVSWGDAILFCNARSKRDHFDTVYTYSGITGVPGALSQVVSASTQFSKLGYRLPTEAEWEYCCKAGKMNDFAWQRDVDYYKPLNDENLNEVSAYEIWTKNSWDLGASNAGFGAHPVGSLQPNPYGLYDMAGNVSEWCNDWSGKYQWGAVIDPTGPSTGTTHVVRGGNWNAGVFYLRGANRYFSVSSGQNEYLFRGFRTIRLCS